MQVMEVITLEQASRELKGLAETEPYSMTVPFPHGKYTRRVDVTGVICLVTFTLTLRLPTMTPYSFYQLSVSPENDNAPKVNDGAVRMLLNQFFSGKVLEVQSPIKNQRQFLQVKSMTAEKAN